MAVTAPSSNSMSAASCTSTSPAGISPHRSSRCPYQEERCTLEFVTATQLPQPIIPPAELR
jgi:hypothetical protein